LRLRATFQLRSFSADCQIPIVVFTHSDLKTTFAYTVVLRPDDQGHFFRTFPSVDVLVTDNKVVLPSPAHDRQIHREFADQLRRVVQEGRTAGWGLQLLTEVKS
jgi:hypothetical protein